MKPMRVTLAALLLGTVALAPNLFGQTATAPTDSAQVWKTLWQPAFDATKSAAVKDLTLVRDRVRITLTEGVIQFAPPLNRVVFAATFHGNGRLHVEPPNPLEAQQLRFFTKQNALDMEFSEATFSFTDNTFEEVAAKVKWSPSGAADDLYAKRQQQREDLGAELLPRLFKSLLSTDRRRPVVFFADLKTKEKGWVEVRFDALEPEEIKVGRWVDVGAFSNFDTWMSFPAGGRSPIQAWQDPSEKEDILIRSYAINATVTSGAELSAATRVTVEPRLASERVLLFLLDSNLRVEKVADAQGKVLEFYQARERKDRNQSYGDYVAVVLAEPTTAGQSQTLEFHYAGKRAVRQVGPGNYFCQSFGWYPTRKNSFAFRSDFEINFRSPKRYTLVATGNKVSETTDGDSAISTWKSDSPIAVAGFAFGDYKVYTEKLGAIDVEIYANREPDDFMRSILHVVQGDMPGQTGRGFGMPAVGSLSPAALVKEMAGELGNTLRLFQAYFGPYPYRHLALTNIPYSYGQGWPNLIYLSALSFLDSTQRNAFGIKEHVQLTDFFRAHESSHQWWGHRVGWKSYHDQWLSEGFADFSGNLYVQFRENPKEYLTRLRKDKQDLRIGDLHNHAYESVGPIWMGSRLSSSESPGGYNTLVYKKGGYVLHMLRMMLFDPRSQNPEQRFQAMMQDFCNTFSNKAASTEDFKTIVEKHMTPAMDIEGNHRMDWFFRQYVYGIGIPQYSFSYRVEEAGEGKWKVTGSVKREGVPDGWMDILPLYLHRGAGVVRLGFVNAVSAQTPFDLVLPFKPEKLSLNDHEDILADIKQ